jgi:putative acetyltransferase
VDLTIRPERADDLDAIAHVVAAAFGSAAEARLVEAIRASDRYLPDLALVATVDGTVAGHVMVSLCDLVDGDDRREVHQLSPLAVAPEHHGRGIGSALVREVCTRAEALGAPFVLLEGDPRFYGRLGFEASARHGIVLPLPSWAPPEAGQILRLRDYDPAVRGRVVYPPAFDTVSDH